MRKNNKAYILGVVYSILFLISLLLLAGLPTTANQFAFVASKLIYIVWFPVLLMAYFERKSVKVWSWADTIARSLGLVFLFLLLSFIV